MWLLPIHSRRVIWQDAPAGSSRCPDGAQEEATGNLYVCDLQFSIEVAMDEAADQLVETDSSAVIIRTTARITMQPLPRYGKPRFIDLNGPLRMCMRIPQTRDIDE